MPLDYSDYPKIDWFPPLSNYKLEDIIGKRILIKSYYKNNEGKIIETGFTESKLVEVSKSKDYFCIENNSALFGKSKLWITKEDFSEIFVDIIEDK